MTNYDENDGELLKVTTPIEITYNKETYLLDYDKSTISYTMPKVAKAQETYDMFGVLFVLFKGAIRTHHPNMKNALIEEIWGDIQDQAGLGEYLSSLLQHRVSEIGDNKSGKTSWSIVE